MRQKPTPDKFITYFFKNLEFNTDTVILFAKWYHVYKGGVCNFREILVAQWE